MRPQKQDSNIILNYILRGKQGIWFLLTPFLFLSCSTELEKINQFIEDQSVPILSGNDVTIENTQMGKRVMHVVASEIARFEKENISYTEFKSGVEVTFYDSIATAETFIRSDYAIYYPEQELWEARDSVVAINLKTNESIQSEEMFWDEKKKTVYSNMFTTIIQNDGIIYASEGFESNQDFTKKKLKKVVKSPLQLND